MSTPSRLICVSNRLPVTGLEESGALEFRPSAGGLVTALGPVLRKTKGVWIGWPGNLTAGHEMVSETLAKFSTESDFDLLPVMLDAEEIRGFYSGFSNQIIWPLFHDLQCRCNFEPEFWSLYLNVQKHFRKVVVNASSEGDLIWVQDFHLMGLAKELRMAGLKNKICFFFHTPFPSPDIFRKLPWRSELIESLLQYDLIGFQSFRDQKNFADCVNVLTPLRPTAKGNVQMLRTATRDVQYGTFPISIDFQDFEDLARSPEVEAHAAKIRADVGVEHVILCVDRLDYTKGIPYRIRAFKRLLEKEESLKKKVVLLQVVVPSREEVPEYQKLREEIEKLVANVNGTFAEPGWVPVQHLFRTLNREELLGMYRASDVALVTPLKDGMNLVAKEYCASRVNSGGALVLSEFAGAAEELKGAELVNPYDLDGVAGALAKIFNTPREELAAKMSDLRETIKKCDVFLWADQFLKAAGWNFSTNETIPRPPTIWERLRKITNVFDM